MIIEAYRCVVRYEKWATKVIVEAALTDEGKKAGAPQPRWDPGENSLSVGARSGKSSVDELELLVEIARKQVTEWCEKQNGAMDVIRRLADSIEGVIVA